jgi:hypothetical protein
MHTEFLSGKPEVQKQFLRQIRRSENSIKTDIKEMGCYQWRNYFFFLHSGRVITMTAPNRSYGLKKSQLCVYFLLFG